MTVGNSLHVDNKGLELLRSPKQKQIVSGFTGYGAAFFGEAMQWTLIQGSLYCISESYQLGQLQRRIST